MNFFPDFRDNLDKRLSSVVNFDVVASVKVLPEVDFLARLAIVKCCQWRLVGENVLNLVGSVIPISGDDSLSYEPFY